MNFRSIASVFETLEFMPGIMLKVSMEALTVSILEQKPSMTYLVARVGGVISGTVWLTGFLYPYLTKLFV